jgi:hypothetical protein
MTRQGALWVGENQVRSEEIYAEPTAYQFCLRRYHVFALHTARDRHRGAVL